MGRAMMDVLAERGFPVGEFHAFASKGSVGKKVRFRGIEHPVQIISEEAVRKGMLLLGATSAEVARQWVPMCLEKGATVVDNSSAYRMEESVPLVVPEVNGGLLSRGPGLVANPNCSTIQLVLVLAPLMQLGEVESVHVATYQSMSGAGGAALRELAAQEAGMPEVGRPHYHRNVVTRIGEPDPDGYCTEELKLMREVPRILSRDIRVYAATARVPVAVGHTEAVTVRFRGAVDRAGVRSALESAPGLSLTCSGLTPRDVEGSDEVFVERLRVHPGDPSAVQLWVLADNVRKGAALNAVQIAELLPGPGSAG